MERVFAVTKGGIARISRLYDDDITMEDAIASWHPDDQAQVTSVREITNADVPDMNHPSGGFVGLKDAWEDDGTAIIVNMPKARVIKTDQIRPERNERLAALDLDYMRADETGDALEKTRIIARKKTLRDLPATIQPTLDAIDTPEALEAWQPAWPE